MKILLIDFKYKLNKVDDAEECDATKAIFLFPCPVQKEKSNEKR